MTREEAKQASKLNAALDRLEFAQRSMHREDMHHVVVGTMSVDNRVLDEHVFTQEESAPFVEVVNDLYDDCAAALQKLGDPGSTSGSVARQVLSAVERQELLDYLTHPACSTVTIRGMYGACDMPGMRLSRAAVTLIVEALRMSITKDSLGGVQ